MDRLNYAQYYPIVVFLRGENKQAIKEVRSRWRAVGNSNKNPKKLHEHNERMDNLYSHLFTGELDDENDDDCVDDDGEDDEFPRNFLETMNNLCTCLFTGELDDDSFCGGCRWRHCCCCQ